MKRRKQKIMCNNLKAKKAAEPILICRQNGQAITRFWDSTSEMRYLVISERPIGSKDWSTENLIDLVARNSMIGVEFAKEPAL